MTHSSRCSSERVGLAPPQGVAVKATIALAVRKLGDERTSFTLATLPQVLDLVRGQHIADNDETVG